MSKEFSRDDQIGDYRVVRKLGQGGMGAVYLVTAPGGRRLALKTIAVPSRLPKAEQERYRQRFREVEARVMAVLSEPPLHPSIVTMHATGEAFEQPFLVMAYVEGVDLAEFGASEPGFERLRKVAVQCASALAFAHGRGVLHRDIKASNVIVMPSDHAMLIDFGLARLAGAERLTTTGVRTGTENYLAPEYLAALERNAPDAHTELTDLWSLGVALYVATAHQYPFEGATASRLTSAIQRGACPPLQELRPDAPPAWCEILHGLLEVDPALRPPSAAALMARLQALSFEGFSSVGPAHATQASSGATLAGPEEELVPVPSFVLPLLEEARREQSGGGLGADGAALAAEDEPAFFTASLDEIRAAHSHEVRIQEAERVSVTGALPFADVLSFEGVERAEGDERDDALYEPSFLRDEPIEAVQARHRASVEMQERERAADVRAAVADAPSPSATSLIEALFAASSPGAPPSGALTTPGAQEPSPKYARRAERDSFEGSGAGRIEEAPAATLLKRGPAVDDVASQTRPVVGAPSTKSAGEAPVSASRVSSQRAPGAPGGPQPRAASRTSAQRTDGRRAAMRKLLFPAGLSATAAFACALLLRSLTPGAPVSPPGAPGSTFVDPASVAQQNQRRELQEIERLRQQQEQERASAAAPQPAGAPTSSAPPPAPSPVAEKPVASKPKSPVVAEGTPPKAPATATTQAAPDDPFIAIDGARPNVNTSPNMTPATSTSGGEPGAAPIAGVKVPVKADAAIVSSPPGPVIVVVTKTTKVGKLELPAGTQIHGETAGTTGARVLVRFKFALLAGQNVPLRGIAYGADSRAGVPATKNFGGGSDIAAAAAGDVVQSIGKAIGDAAGPGVARDAVRGASGKTAGNAARIDHEEQYLSTKRGLRFFIYVEGL